MGDKNQGADLRLLGLGALCGLIIAGVGILQREGSGDALPGSAIARVNDVIISRDQYDRAVTRAIDFSDDGTLQHLIDDELLVQRGVALGMNESDLSVRQAIVDSLVASITAEADAASPSEEELASYLESHAERFSYVSRVSAEAWQTDDESAAQTFIAALRDNAVTPATEAVEPMPDLPAGLMDLETFAAYVGPGIAAATAEMPPGSSAVFARRGRWLIVRIDSREKSIVTELDAVRNRVLIDYRRELAEQTLRDYVEGLRETADIVVATP